MKTGKHLRIRDMGDKVQGVDLEGDPLKPEPVHFRVLFPGGDVDIVRCDDDTYWVHVSVNRKTDALVVTEDAVAGQVIDGRMDVEDKHASECDAGELGNNNLYHLAVRVGRK